MSIPPSQSRKFTPADHPPTAKPQPPRRFRQNSISQVPPTTIMKRSRSTKSEPASHPAQKGTRPECSSHSRRQRRPTTAEVGALFANGDEEAHVAGPASLFPLSMPRWFPGADWSCRLRPRQRARCIALRPRAHQPRGARVHRPMGGRGKGQVAARKRRRTRRRRRRRKTPVIGEKKKGPATRKKKKKSPRSSRLGQPR